MNTSEPRADLEPSPLTSHGSYFRLILTLYTSASPKLWERCQKLVGVLEGSVQHDYGADTNGEGALERVACKRVCHPERTQGLDFASEEEACTSILSHHQSRHAAMKSLKIFPPKSRTSKADTLVFVD